MPRKLPRRMHESHGAYYYVVSNKWHPLGKDLRKALVAYSSLIGAKAIEGELQELFDRAMADMKPSLAKKTYYNYTRAVIKILDAFAEFTPQQVKPIHIAAFLDHHKGTPSLANLYRALLSGVFTRAVRWGVTETNPVRDIRQFKTTKRDRYITPDEFKRIHTAASPTLACLMDVAYITGQRIGDVMKIRYADISTEGIYVKQDKTKARILIAMTPDLEAAIAKAKSLHHSVRGLTLFHKPDGKPLVYGAINRQWVIACKVAGVENAHFHDIRAASATDADAQGIDSKALLGHTTEGSHNRYLRSKVVPVAQPVPARKS